MQFVTDLHLHSKYSRAVSQMMTLPVMADFARQKGLDILTTGDFTHPVWFKEIQGQLEEAGGGIYKLKKQKAKVKSISQNSKAEREVLFLLSTEIASIYKHGEKLRRIHNLIFVPNFEVAEKVKQELVRRGCNLNADGRPIIGISSRNLLEMLLSIDERNFLIPCHVWTPHFGVYGSKSGFDSLEEAFGDLAKFVYAIETGISSDPEMNWRIGELKNRSILSFSDAHSPGNMGREATVFKIKDQKSKNKTTNQKLNISYDDFRLAIMRDPSGILEISYTLEFYPEEGKYHYSGHRNCKVCLTPEEVLAKGTKCPVCGREFTEGVAIRIEQLAGADFAHGYKEKMSESGIKWYTDSSKNHPPYVKLVRLEQIIAAGLGVTPNTIKVKNLYSKLTDTFDSELNILLKTPIYEVERVAGSQIANALSRVRGGQIEIVAGYDGEYGKVKVFGTSEQNFSSVAKQNENGQLGLDI